MLEDSDKVRDSVKFSELPPKQQEDYQVFAMQQIILGLMLYLKEPLYTYLSDKEVKRDLEHVTPPVRHGTEIEGAVPSPRAVRDMIRPDGFWVISGIDPMKHIEAMGLTEKLVRLLYEPLPPVR
jgi:hypothetical protein